MRSGRGQLPCARKTIERVREEPSAHQINSSRREEAGPGGGLCDTCLSDGNYFPALSDALPPFQSDLAWRHTHITAKITGDRCDERQMKATEEGGRL